MIPAIRPLRSGSLLKTLINFSAQKKSFSTSPQLSMFPMAEVTPLPFLSMPRNWWMLGTPIYKMVQIPTLKLNDGQVIPKVSFPLLPNQTHKLTSNSWDTAWAQLATREIQPPLSTKNWSRPSSSQSTPATTTSTVQKVVPPTLPKTPKS